MKSKSMCKIEFVSYQDCPLAQQGCFVCTLNCNLASFETLCVRFVTALKWSVSVGQASR